MTEQLFVILRSTKFKEYATVVVGILLGARKCLWKVSMEGYEPAVVGTTSDRPEGLARISVHLVESDEKLISDVVGFGGRHTVDNSVERHALAFLHEEIPNALHPVLAGLNDGGGEGGVA